MNAVTTIARSGTVFKPETGKLYEFLAPSGRIWVLRAWPSPMAWRKTRGTPYWAHFRPEIQVPEGDLGERIRRLVAPSDASGQYLMPFAPGIEVDWTARIEVAWLQWYQAIPAEVRAAIAPFPKRQWHLLSFVARCGPAALDLVRANPALAFALASNWVFHRPAVQQPLRAARSLLARGKKQRDILDWLGFPGSEPTRKLLARVVPSSASISALLYLRQSVPTAETAKALSHLQRINAGAIRIGTDAHLLPVTAPSLLEEIAHARAEDKRPKAAYLLRDSIAMFAALYPRHERFVPIRCLRRLREVHDTLIEQINGRSDGWINAPFPPPPIVGTPLIQPITSSRDLADEGRDQHNCVVSYAHDIAVLRRTYIYRTVPPLDRCTLSLRRIGDQWGIGEIKGACNEPAPLATRQAVAQWLASASGRDVGDGGNVLDGIPF